MFLFCMLSYGQGDSLLMRVITEWCSGKCLQLSVVLCFHNKIFLFSNKLHHQEQTKGMLHGQ